MGYSVLSPFPTHYGSAAGNIGSPLALPGGGASYIPGTGGERAAAPARRTYRKREPRPEHLKKRKLPVTEPRKRGRPRKRPEVPESARRRRVLLPVSTTSMSALLTASTPDSSVMDRSAMSSSVTGSTFLDEDTSAAASAFAMVQADERAAAAAAASAADSDFLGDQSSLENSSAPRRHLDGLKFYSGFICHYVKHEQHTSQRKICLILQRLLRGEVDFENIRRRVYDTVNVLASMGYLMKLKKPLHKKRFSEDQLVDLKWIGLPMQRQEYDQLVERCRALAEVEQSLQHRVDAAKSTLRMLKDRCARSQRARQAEEGEEVEEEEGSASVRGEVVSAADEPASSRIYPPFYALHAESRSAMTLDADSSLSLSSVEVSFPYQPVLLRDVAVYAKLAMVSTPSLGSAVDAAPASSVTATQQPQSPSPQSKVSAGMSSPRR
jgi:hypothetical protein